MVIMKKQNRGTAMVIMTKQNKSTAMVIMTKQNRGTDPPSCQRRLPTKNKTVTVKEL
jgi:hypothetical protein